MIKVNVTQRDIQYGVRYDGGRCPVARAFKRAVRCNDVRVNADSIEAVWYDARGNEGRRVSYYPPDNMVEFVRAFDLHDVMTPQVFYVLE